MRPWGLLCLLLTATTTVADNVALFWNLYDAVISGGRILHDVADGVGTVSKAIRAIDSFLDSTAEAQVTEALKKAETDAPQEQTTADRTTPRTADATTPTATAPAAPSISGCGALGLHIRDDSLPLTRLTECCGAHESCYGAACKANKRDCDGRLRSCLFAVCDDRSMAKAQGQACRGAAKLLFSGTMALSFQQYNTAQEKLNCRKQEKGKKR